MLGKYPPEHFALIKGSSVLTLRYYLTRSAMTEHRGATYSSYTLLTELEKKFATKGGQQTERSSSGNDNNSSPGQSPGPLAQNRPIRQHFPRSNIVAPLASVSILETKRYTNDARRSLQQARNLAAIRRHAVPRINQAPSPRADNFESPR